jgi:exodeoxyribonuclease-3
MPLRIATWNINSVRLRIDLVRRFIAGWSPDVLCLQETKTRNATFPHEDLERLGYRHRLIHGMKSYNGVAILSRVPFTAGRRKRWCKRADCRYLVAKFDRGLELHNFYVPAGGDLPDPAANPKFAHKLQFLEEMADWFAGRPNDSNKPMVLVGDLNVAPLETDVWSHKQMLKVVSHTPGEVDRLIRIGQTLRWVDAPRRFVPGLGGVRPRPPAGPHLGHRAAGPGARPRRDRPRGARLGAAVRPCAGFNRNRVRCEAAPERRCA